MKYALIGCGRISPNHVVAAKNSGLDIVAMVDIERKNVEDKIIKFDLKEDKINIYTDYKEMLEKEKPELVAIATESGKHAPIALDCLDYSCNLIIEKPIALSIEEANSIIIKGREKGVKVCACHQNRFNKSIVEIRKAVEKNRFGKLLYGTAHVRWTRDHDKFKNGSYGIIEGTTDVFPRNLEETLYIFGEKGTVKAGGEAVNIIEEWKFSDYFGDEERVKRECAENPPNVYGFGHTKLYKNVIGAIEGTEQLVADAEAGKKALELVLAIYKSAAEGVPVKLPLENCSTMDFFGRFH